MKGIAGLVLAIIVASMAGCTLKMGNTEARLLEGWNQPTVQSQKTETISPVTAK